MNAKLIALTLAALPAPALADVTLYGELKVGMGRNTITNGATSNGVQDNISLLGVKGSEIIKPGLKALWQIESRVHIDSDNSADTLASRESFFGLDGGKLGMIRIGYLDNALNDLYRVDQWQYAANVSKSTGSGNSVQNTGVNGLAVFTNPGSTMKNALRYDSASFYGFSGNLGYSFGENNNSGSPAIKRASDILSFGVNYAHGPYFVGYGFQQEANPLAGQNYLTTPDATAAVQTGGNIERARIHYAELGYQDEKLFLGLGYQLAQGYDWTDTLSGDSKSNFGSASTPLSAAQAKLKTRQAALSAAYTLGAYTPKISYAKGWDQSANGERQMNSGYRQFVVGVDYQLSKRTRSGLSYGRMSMDANARTAVMQGKTTLATTAMTVSHRF
jgi:predicted porin